MSRRAKTGVLVFAAAILAAVGDGCAGLGGGGSGGYTGTYDCTGTTTTPAGTTNGTGTFSCTGSSCADSMSAFVGTVDGNGDFTGTDTLCQTCVPLPMTGHMSTSGPFTLAGSSGSVSATFHCQCSGVCGGGGTGTGGDGGSPDGGSGGGSPDGGSGGGSPDGGSGGGPPGPLNPVLGSCTGYAQAAPGATVTCDGTYPTDVAFTLKLCGITIPITSISSNQIAFVIPPMSPGVCELEVAGPTGGSGERFLVQPTPVPLGSDPSGPEWIAVDSSYVYWTDSGGMVMKATLDGATVTTLASGLLGPQGIAIDAANVYWADSAGVKKIAKGGGAITTLGAGIASFVAVDSSSVYWTVNGPPATGAVKKVGIGGGTPITLASGLTNPRGIAVDSSSVYWADSAGAIKKVSINGGPVTSLAPAVYPQAVTVQGGNVYWTQYTTTISGVFMVPASGGAVTTISSRDGQGVAADASGVYWTSYGGGAVSQYGVVAGQPQSIQLATGLTYPVGIATDATSVYVTEQTPGGRIIRLAKLSP